MLFRRVFIPIQVYVPAVCTHAYMCVPIEGEENGTYDPRFRQKGRSRDSGKLKFKGKEGEKTGTL